MKCGCRVPVVHGTPSHLARGAWIEIVPLYAPLSLPLSHLARGAWIEIGEPHAMNLFLQSHLARGAWIEIIRRARPVLPVASHLARGAWIEIVNQPKILVNGHCRTSQEVRGLKSSVGVDEIVQLLSHLARGVWIEIWTLLCTHGIAEDFARVVVVPIFGYKTANDMYAAAA